MNPTDHEGRIDSPFIEFAESADMGVEVHVHPATPVSARDAVGVVPSILPRRRDLWTPAAIVAACVLVGLGLYLAVWGWS